MSVLIKVKVELQGNFAAVPMELIVDKKIDGDMLACMVCLLAKPPNWTLHHNQLRGELGWGSERTYRVLRDLRKTGYVIFLRQPNPHGHNDTSIYVVFESLSLAENWCELHSIDYEAAKALKHVRIANPISVTEVTDHTDPRAPF